MRSLSKRGVLASVVLSVLSGVALAQQGPPPAKVVTDGVRQETIEQLRGATGEIRTRRRSRLAAEEPGLVVELDLEAGDAVERGQVIARLDDTLVRLDVDRAEARLAFVQAQIDQREAELNRSVRDLERIEELDRSGSASVSEIDEFRTRVAADRALVAQARADLEIARVELATARERLDDMAIRAPFDGRIVRRESEIGQWLARGDSVVEVVSLRDVEAWVDVPERVVGRLRELHDAGQRTVEVAVPALDGNVEATLIEIVPEGDPLSRMFPVRLAIDNSQERLKPGMSLVAMVPTSERAPTLTIHKDAILRDDAGEYVYFDAGGMAMVARVSRLFAFGERVAIRPGQLKPGMRVIVEGNERIFPTQPLAILGTLDGAPVPGAPGASGDAPGGPTRGEDAEQTESHGD